MATYKLIQDIEAEDHILGPLTLRQFIFALIAVFLFYINFLVVTKGVAFLLVIFAPPALFFAFFALPFGRDQPTEIWALAKLRYFFKPRQRIWNQSGVKELVTITVPKKVEKVLTNGLSQTEVKSRLQALASTLDTRGWAVKNVSAETYAMPTIMMPTSSDRLVNVYSMVPQTVSADVPADSDVFDANNNPLAQKFQSMITQSSQAHRQELIDEMNQPAKPASLPSQVSAAPTPDYWFMQAGPSPTAGGATAQAQAPAPALAAPVAAAPIDPAQEAALSAQLRAQHSSSAAPYGHMRTMQPLGAQPAQPPADYSATASGASPVTEQPDPAILSLANNDDLDVATLAREAQRAKDEEGRSGDEVVISLR